MSQTVWLVRHGNRQDFADPEWYRTALRPHDPALSVDGMEQVTALASHLQDRDIDRIFASPFLRTIETAHQIANRLHLSVSLEAGLGEVLSPQLFRSQPTLLSSQSIQSFYPSVDIHYASRTHAQFPETHEEAIARCGQTVAALANDHNPDNILLVCHKVGVLAGTWALLGKRLTVATPLAGVTILKRQDTQWRLIHNEGLRHPGTNSHFGANSHLGANKS